MSSRASLNHIFRTVWNQALGAMVAVAETDSSSSGNSGRRIRNAVLQRPPEVDIGLLALSIAIAWSALPSLAIANPTGGVAVVGQATFANNGNKLLVTTQNGASGNYSAINWQSFSIPAGSSTYFQQPTVTSTSINRVVTNTPTQIFGSLSSNGNLVLVNQAGIAVGTGAVVDTNGFTASSLAMSDQDAMAGRLRFGDGTISTTGVSVHGSVLARSGDVVLLGANVNTGVDAVVQAPNGSAILAAGQQIDITGRGLEGILLQVQAPTDSAINLGTLKGDAVGMFAGTLKHSGLIQATTASLEGGRVVLKSMGDTYVDGNSKINATGSVGGSVDVLGKHVAVWDKAVIDVSGETGGGSIRAGGDYQGMNPAIANSQVTYLGSDASLIADAGASGDGGKVIVWGDKVTRANGIISAHGGADGGRGGFIETSGAFLDVAGIRVNASGGKAGTWLLDPTDIQITSGNTFNTSVTGGGTQTFTSDLTNTLGTASSIPTATIVTALGSFDVVVDSTGASPASGVQAGNILISGNNLSLPNSIHNLTLTAAGNITLNADVDLASSGGTGSLIMNATAGTILQSSFSHITVKNLKTNTTSFTQSDPAATAGSAPTIVADQIELQGGSANLGSVTGTTITANKLKTNLTGSLYFKNSGSFQIDSGNVVVGGAGTLNSFGGAITQAGTITANSLDASAYAGVTLTNAGNSVGTFSGNNTMTGGISFTNSGALTLGAISTGANNLAVTAGGAITQTASALTIGGTSTFNATSGAITLTTASNAFTGAVSVSTTGSSNASVTAGSTGVNIGTATVGGTLALVAGTGGTISQVNSIIANTLDLTLGTDGYASLNNSFNQVGTFKLSKTGGGTVTNPVSFLNSGALTLGAITTDKDLNISVDNYTSITQSAAVVVGGAASFNVGYGSIVLANAANNFSTLNLTAASATIKDANNLVVASLSVPDSTNAAPSLIEAIGNLTLTGGLTTYASGDAIKLVSGGTLSGSAGTINLGTVGARWLAYLGSTGGNTFPSTYDITNDTYLQIGFKQYNASIGSSILGSGNGVLFSAAPTLSASVAGSVTKVYDGSTSIGISGATVGAVSGTPLAPDDISSASASLVSGTLSSPNVGSSIPVSFSGTVSGVVTGYGDPVGVGLPIYGYQFTASGLGDVTPARAIATISGTGTRVYDGTNFVNASIFTLSGLVGTETLGFSGVGTVADKNVGSNKAVTLGSLALADGTGLAQNYTLTGGTFTASITPLAISGISGVGADSKIYDGKDSAVANSANAVVTGLLSPGGVKDVVNVSAASATANFADKKVGTGRTVTITGLTLVGADAANYSMTAGQSATTAKADITPLTLGAISGLTTSKTYDGNTDAKGITLTGAKIGGVIVGDVVLLGGTVDGSYADRNVGTKAVVLTSTSGLTLTGTDAGNYVLSPTLTGSGSGTINQRTASQWTGLGNNGLWSDPKNWDALPDGNNVAGVIGLDNAVVIYDLGVSTQLSALTVRNLTVSGSGGLVLGGLSVTSGYNQISGTVTSSAPVTIAQTSGNLVVGTMTAPSVTLNSAGAISQSGPLTVGALTTTSTAGTTLDNAGNHISAFNGTNTGTGSITVTTVGPVDLRGITTTNGDVKVLNFGGITTTAAITAQGAVTLTANSPLTINAPISATGNIDLVATNQTSEGNITINGQVSSSGGSIAVAAASNYLQNGTISAAKGVTATAGGTMTFGPDAITTGNPVNFQAAGATVIPPGSTPTVGSTPTDFVATFMSHFEDALIAQNGATGDPNDKKKDKDLVVEGQSCTR